MSAGTFSLTQVQSLPLILVKARNQPTTSRTQKLTPRLDSTQDHSRSTEPFSHSRTSPSLPVSERFQATNRQIEA